MGRPTTALLSSESIARAALDLIDDGRDPTMRAIAARLSVSAPSLYYHVKNKDGVVNLIRDLLVRDAPSIPEDAHWRDVAEAVFRDVYHLYATRPRLAVLFAQTPISSTGVLDIYQHLAEAIMAAGVDARDTAVVLEMLDSYAIGLGVEHAAPSTVWEVTDLDSPLARAAAAWPEPSARLDEAFERGLRLILDHVESIIWRGESRSGVATQH